MTAHGNTLAFAALLGVGADPSKITRWSKLHAASAGQNARIETVRQLLANGTDVNVRDEFGNTPLMWAYLPKIVKLLLKHGADINAQTKTGESILHVTAHSQSTQINLLEFLLGNGADPNISNRRGLTPLMIAARNGNSIYIATLLRAGANIEAKDRRGRTAIHHAALAGMADAIEILSNRGANVNSTNRWGGLTLSMAVWGNYRNDPNDLISLEGLLAEGAQLSRNSEKLEKLWRSLNRIGKPMGKTIALRKKSESGEPIFGRKFSCQFQPGYTERAICGNMSLLHTHRRMSEFYDARRRAFRGKALKAAIQEHRIWVRRRTTECRQAKFNPDTIVADITPCLLSLTTTRLRALKNKPTK